MVNEKTFNIPLFYTKSTLGFFSQNRTLGRSQVKLLTILFVSISREVVVEVVVDLLSVIFEFTDLVTPYSIRSST